MISVIIPIFNVVDLLPFCIESVLNQTFSDFELLLIDDGSNDGSEKLCDNYKKIDERILVIHKENEGEYSARNIGLREAKGEYVAFVDADDVIHPEYLKILYNAIKETDSDLVVCNFIKKKLTSQILDFVDANLESYIEITGTNIFKHLFCNTEFMTCWCKLYKKSKLDEIYFIERSIGLDVEFNSRVYLNINKCVLIPEVLYYWIERPSSVTRKGFSQKHLESLDCYYKAWENIPQNLTQCKAYALQRLLKVMLYTRYNASKDFKKNVAKKEKNIFKKIYKPFFKNQFIPVKMKISLFLFYKIPLSYCLFRKYQEKKFRHS